MKYISVLVLFGASYIVDENGVLQSFNVQIPLK
ncbi:hypothetical protein HNQ90_001489 [Algibacter amylolyticus]|nr:hypothetical protein [Algibacter amylolyticus]